MMIAAIQKGNTQPGDQIIILSQKEAQDMYNVYQKFCEQNPRQKKAKKVFQQMEDEFEIW